MKSSIAWALMLVAGLAHARRAAADDGVEQQARPALGVGVAVGQPTWVTAKVRLFDGAVAAGAGVGTRLTDRPGLHLHAGVTAELELGVVDLSLGGGGRFERHRFDPESLDETGSDTHVGLRAGATAGRRVSETIEVFVETAGVVDVYRSPSCALLSGAMSVCPHEGDSPFELQLAVGARYWLEL